MGQLMKAVVHVSLKKTVLDPQGQTIARALEGMGYSTVRDVRQGKFFEIELDGAAAPDQARVEVEKIAREILTNPVIEDFACRLEE